MMLFGCNNFGQFYHLVFFDRTEDRRERRIDLGGQYNMFILVSGSVGASHLEGLMPGVHSSAKLNVLF